MMARAGEEIGVNLAVSLHAVTKEVRDEIVPINRKYGIEELLQACADYPGANNARRITFEYVMLKDKNDSDEDAHELVRLIKKYKLPAKVNLIPFNPWPGATMMLDAGADPGFSDIIFEGGISAPVRTPRGRDIDAACGQLKTASEKKSGRSSTGWPRKSRRRLADPFRGRAFAARGAGLLGGAMNALAGGGTFATMPTLIALGLPVAHRQRDQQRRAPARRDRERLGLSRRSLEPLAGISVRWLAAITFVGGLDRQPAAGRDAGADLRYRRALAAAARHLALAFGKRASAALHSARHDRHRARW
jgi:hypothetical protein